MNDEKKKKFQEMYRLDFVCSDVADPDGATKYLSGAE